MREIEKLVDNFLNSPGYWSGVKEETVKNLLKGNSIHSFLNKYKCDYLDKEEIANAILDSIKAISSPKPPTIRIYKKLLIYIKEKYCIDVNINFPKIDIGNRLDRISYMVKRFQDKNVTRDMIQEELLISDRTYDSDYAILKGRGNEDFNFQGNKIGSMTKDDFKKSTAHPVLLVSNLTQILVTLSSLEQMSRKNKMYKNYCFKASLDIWSQLSDYAKERLLYVYSEVLKEDITWYEKLNNSDSKSLFVLEEDMGEESIEDRLLYFLKDSKKCYILYQDESDKEILLKNCYIKMNFDDHKLINIKCNNEILEVDRAKIINIYIKEELI